MGEIKSTIDLVMEKTRDMKLTEEEKQKIEQEKEYRKAQGLVARLLQGDQTVEMFLQDAEGASEQVGSELLQALIEGLRLRGEYFTKGLEALERWKGAAARRSIKRMRDLGLQFGQALQKRKRKVRAELWKELAERGVQGSAVEPNVEVSPLWERTVQSLEEEFEPRLNEIKTSLKKEVGFR
jgi:hypothetical protein